MEDNIKNVLTPEFLCELYNSAFDDDYMCSILYQYMDNEYLPDKDFQTLNTSLKAFFREHKHAPKYGVVRQMMSRSRAVTELLDDIKKTADGASKESLRQQFENYLKQQSFKKDMREITKLYDGGDPLKAIKEFQARAHKMTSFSLEPDEFVDVAKTFESRLLKNREVHDNPTDTKLVNQFYIDELDARNNGRNLRTQLTLWLAMSGVGKSHVARWIGKNAAYVGGLDVLHIQLEGSESEILDAYSASLVDIETYQYENGNVNSHIVDTFKKNLEMYAGTLKVKAYPKFGKKVSTIDIRNEFEKYKNKFGKYPDVGIIDSLDLLTDSTGTKYDNKGVRFERINVAKDLKDIAGETNCWMNATYQATIEDPDWANDEKHILESYHLSEAKGLQRPCTHIISLNRSKNEEFEQTMRLNVAKSRFFPRGKFFKICTDYDHENFYDRMRTLNLPKD